MNKKSTVQSNFEIDNNSFVCNRKREKKITGIMKVYV